MQLLFLDSRLRDNYNEAAFSEDVSNEAASGEARLDKHLRRSAGS